MSDHTPGPWESIAFTEHTGEETMRIIPVNGYGIPRGDGPIGETYSRTLGIPDETAIANARLIASAPDLLGIVRRLAEWEESGPWEDLDKIASDAVVLWAKMKSVVSGSQRTKEGRE